jgi:hypothetical protein
VEFFCLRTSAALIALLSRTIHMSMKIIRQAKLCILLLLLCCYSLHAREVRSLSKNVTAPIRYLVATRKFKKAVTACRRRRIFRRCKRSCNLKSSFRRCVTKITKRRCTKHLNGLTTKGLMVKGLRIKGLHNRAINGIVESVRRRTCAGLIFPTKPPEQSKGKKQIRSDLKERSNKV